MRLWYSCRNIVTRQPSHCVTSLLITVCAIGRLWRGYQKFRLSYPSKIQIFIQSLPKLSKRSTFNHTVWVILYDSYFIRINYLKTGIAACWLSYHWGCDNTPGCDKKGFENNVSICTESFSKYKLPVSEVYCYDAIILHDSWLRESRVASCRPAFWKSKNIIQALKFGSLRKPSKIPV